MTLEPLSPKPADGAATLLTVWKAAQARLKDGRIDSPAIDARLLLEAASTPARVLKEPAPAVAMTAFGADGLEFTLGYWIADPENGTLNIRSLINRKVLQALRENQIEIPYPQRVLHIQPTAPEPLGSAVHEAR